MGTIINCQLYTPLAKNASETNFITNVVSKVSQRISLSSVKFDTFNQSGVILSIEFINMDGFGKKS